MNKKALFNIHVQNHRISQEKIFICQKSVSTISKSSLDNTKSQRTNYRTYIHSTYIILRFAYL